MGLGHTTSMQGSENLATTAGGETAPAVLLLNVLLRYYHLDRESRVSFRDSDAKWREPAKKLHADWWQRATAATGAPTRATTLASAVVGRPHSLFARSTLGCLVKLPRPTGTMFSL